MDLLWLLPPGISVNRHTTKDWFLGEAKRIHLPSAGDLCELIRKAGLGAFFYSADMARVSPNFSSTLEIGHSSVSSLKGGTTYIDISLPFRLRWVASHCQLSRGHQHHLQGIEEAGLDLLNYK